MLTKQKQAAPCQHPPMLYRIFFLLTLALPGILVAGPGKPGYSDAGPDGPYVMYVGKKIVVKSLELQDSSVVIRSRTYSDRNEIILDCHVPESNDNFFFSLQEKLIVPDNEYVLPENLLVLSDIEGNFQAMKRMLVGAKVMDDEFNWSYGTGHLVLVGDFFDRGLNVTECLWLIYKLEKEARLAGGMVHFIMGNHEIMNLAGNTLYNRKKYQANANLLGLDYSSDLYGINSELGRWLRTKNAVEKIGNYVFCHGGYSPELADTGLSLYEINEIARLHYGVPNRQMSREDAKAVFNVRTGIFWYRKAAKNQLDASSLDKVLFHTGAEHIVVGHTLVEEVSALYGGSVICIDLHHDENERLGVMKTLYIYKGRPYSLDSEGTKSSIYKVVFPKGE